MTEILTGRTATELFQDLVREGQQRAHAALDEDTESYLVFALMRHLRDAPLAHRIMALEYLETLLNAGTLREQQLRDVGDRCLLIAGLYPELAERRRVSLRYFVDLGQVAYDQLAHQAREVWSTLYAHLARRFAQLVRVLVEIRGISGDWQGLSLFDRHDLVTDDPMAADTAFPRAIVVAASRRSQ